MRKMVLGAPSQRGNNPPRDEIGSEPECRSKQPNRPQSSINCVLEEVKGGSTVLQIFTSSERFFTW